MDILDLIIIGGGPAGLTAGIYAGRAKLKTLLLAGSPSGGQLMFSGRIDDFPGFPADTTGPELIHKITEQAKKFGIEFLEQNVIAVDFKNKPFTVKTEKKEYKSRAVIVATGATAKWLGLENEQKLIGHGISVCAICDGFFFKDKDVAVVGGGDSAMENAVILTKYARRVYIIHRRRQLKASLKLQEEAQHNPKIEFIWNSEIVRIQDTDLLEGVEIENTETKEKTFLPVAGLFVSIGYKPQTEIFQDQLDLDDYGYIQVAENTQTSIKGVFAAGDVCDIKYRQAITSAGWGAMALLDADRWLRKGGSSN